MTAPRVRRGAGAAQVRLRRPSVHLAPTRSTLARVCAPRVPWARSSPQRVLQRASDALVARTRTSEAHSVLPSASARDGRDAAAGGPRHQGSLARPLRGLAGAQACRATLAFAAGTRSGRLILVEWKSERDAVPATSRLGSHFDEEWTPAGCTCFVIHTTFLKGRVRAKRVRAKRETRKRKKQWESKASRTGVSEPKQNKLRPAVPRKTKQTTLTLTLMLRTSRPGAVFLFLRKESPDGSKCSDGGPSPGSGRIGHAQPSSHPHAHIIPPPPAHSKKETRSDLF